MTGKLNSQTGTVRRRRTKKKSVWKTVLTTFILVAVWSGLVYSGYWYMETRIAENFTKTKNMIEQAVKSVQETNALNVQELEEKVIQLVGEMEEIKDALEDTDDTLSQSNSSREELNARIEELDNQLEELEKSLEILKGNGNAKN